MPINVLGLLPYADESEIKQAERPFDPDFIRTLAQTYDRYGYHRILIAQSARSPDSLPVAAHLSACTTSLGFMIAHRPGFVVPTMAARMLSTIDQMSGGRAAVHIITAVNDAETRADGDFLTKDERYRRSREYVALLRRSWTSPEPFDHQGDFYHLEGAATMVRPVRGTIPVYWGGSSELGVQFGGECADIYAFAGTSLQRSAELISRVSAAGKAHGRTPGFLMSIRVVIAETDEAAWNRARALSDTLHRSGAARLGLGSGSDESAARRIAEAAAACGAADPCLWAGVIEATAGRSHAMALVGSPATLAKALLAYHDLGVEEFLLRGFDNLADAEIIGRELIPRLKCGAEPRSPAGQAGRSAPSR